MKLAKARVTNYRNIIDSNEIEIGATTCLVGKNEAGKTAFLKALEGLRSTDGTFTEYGKVENYPRRYFGDYEQRHAGQEGAVAATVWEMSPEDIAAIEAVLDDGVVTGKFVSISKTYEQKVTTWSVPIDGEKVLVHLVRRFGLTKEEKAGLGGAKSTSAAAKALEALPDKTEHHNQLLAAIKQFRDNNANLAAIDILSKRTPQFLYFSHYDRMSGEISINQLTADKNTPQGIKIGDQVFLDFLEYAGTRLEELADAKRFEELNARCEAAANRITDQIFEYWTQNDELQIQVLLTEGKPEDNPPFNTGPIARARVENNLHKVTVPFSERSAGFIWFFSFLVKFAQVQKTESELVLLLDEPGLTLHGKAQADLLRYFREKLAPDHQVIYTTHSPFMVPPDQLLSVRIVEDRVTSPRPGVWHSDGTKVREDVLATERDTLFPLQGALGYE